MRKTARGFLPLVLVLTLAFMGCQNEQVRPDRDPRGMLVSYQGCKTSLPSDQGRNLEPAQKTECLQYNYKSGGILELNHLNAAFNCCPGNIFSDISIVENTIVIQEGEQGPFCHCLCLYDVNYELFNLPPGRYLIIVKGPCTSDEGLAMKSVLELFAPRSGISCVDRMNYPWGN